MSNEEFTVRDADADIKGENFPLDDNSYVLPPRTLAYRLVDLFLDHVPPILPLVHEPTFRNELDELYDKRKSAGIAFRSLVNVVFAYGCDYLELDLARTYELSQDFHERATDLILLVCYELASLEVVQAALLVTLHLNSSMQFHRMWINTGLLVRTAQALNLHLDPSDWNIGMIEKELPLNIETGHPVLPSAADDDQILPTYIVKSRDPTRQPSQLHFFNCLMQLIHISETALSSYSTNAPWVLSKQKNNNLSKDDPRKALYIQMAMALEQESKLVAWLGELPEHLRFDFSNSDPKLRKQRRSLQTRYLHTRLMIHRMNMIPAIRPDKGNNILGWNDKFAQSILSSSIQQCIECSCELIGLVTEYYEQNTLDPWWLLLQVIFTILATLFAVRARRNILQNLDDNSINITLEKAMSLLHSLGDINPALTQCRQYFESLMSCAVTQGALLDGEKVYGLKLPTDPQFQTTSFPHTRNPVLTFQQRPKSSIQNVVDGQARNIHLLDADQTMADYPAELFADATFGNFNFGALDPTLQM
ncbi:uncharacterized protein Z518_03182 [Rhinocladiella mackenziei CBS 650.93]|uniref:Xylanolytic transcriptional activator regulatory domain-containing protein n=1 Tax=Rhinocladiella mackenziei CBS 650.93 TaxID=1442369 RepID=A0A0D2IYV0_9EURO|nr:uncharacterized protein Z518_03182 [Rhinocladiella mackenziei CBS 650.93]KIX08526.1 hypothetical protein Z518_03182 [Rhinocladiella mackenziei CBS 650.93]